MQELQQNKRSLLESPHKGVDAAENPLARLWRQILRDLGMEPYRWQQLMDRFLKNPRNGIPSTSRDQSSARGNLNKELFKTRLTFPTMMRGLALLDPRKIRFEVHMTWNNGKTTVHGVDVLTRRSVLEHGQAHIDAMPDEIDDMLQTGHVAQNLQIEAPPEQPDLPPLPQEFLDRFSDQVQLELKEDAQSSDAPPWLTPEEADPRKHR